MVLSLLAAPDPEYRVAVLPFNGVNITEQEVAFHSEHFAQQMALTGGLKVTSAQQIQALIGLERQKELVGCADDASQCMAELANALGSEVVVAGSIGKFGHTFQINLKALSAVSAEVLVLASGSASSEHGVLSELTRLARRMASDLRVAFRKQQDARARAERLAAEEARRAELKRAEEERRRSSSPGSADGQAKASAEQGSAPSPAEERSAPADALPLAAAPLRPVATSASRASPLVITAGVLVGCAGLAILATPYPLVGVGGIAAGAGLMVLGINWGPDPEKAAAQASLWVSPSSLSVAGHF